MADDELVLNFGTPASSTAHAAPPRAAKGGRWTDRAKERKRSQIEHRRATKQQQKPSTNKPSQRDDAAAEGEAGAPGSQSSKTKATHSSNSGAGGGGGRGRLERAVGPAGQKQYISSLFTAEGLPVPSTSSSTGGKSADGPDPAPELTKLGLSREIVAALAGKLGITGPTACQAGAIPRLLHQKLPTKNKGKGKGKGEGQDSSSFAHDAILRAQTGSGKTLTFLLPMLEDLLHLPPSTLNSAATSSTSGPGSIDRSIGTLALILAPTRELATQIHTVLSSLLSALPSSSRFTVSPRTLTAGLLVGGANRTHEKRRLRKGCPIVVATPGRLLDHLKTTEAFRWLIVDECDRLMDLGFEEQMRGILEEIQRRSSTTSSPASFSYGPSPSSSSSSSSQPPSAATRRTILCSATASEGVDRLAGLAIEAAAMTMPVIGARDDVQIAEPVRKDLTTAAATGFTPPSQLLHHYVIVPPKLRFVALVALLRKLLVKQQRGGGPAGKILVFMSCTDAVDFWWKALGKIKMGGGRNGDDEGEENEWEKEDKDADADRLVSLHPLLSGIPIYRLHGSLPLKTRLASLNAFSKPYTIEEGHKKAGQETDAGVLLCTSVAARGLDVKNVACVVQVDAPTEGGVTEYVHRVGRTARAGAQGTAYSFVLPNESEYPSYLEEGINAKEASSSGKREEKVVKLREVGVEQVLREGYGGEGREYETRATDVQMGFERWVNGSEESASLARKAFQAHIRAYATHPAAEKHLFNLKAVHLGHLAKSFGMREAPGHHLASSNGGPARKKARTGNSSAGGFDDGSGSGSGGGFEVGRRRKTLDAEARMRKLMRGPQANGGGEFQIAGAGELEGLVSRGGSKR
ncbi:DEAD-domain-containing protein [Rhodotorula sp. JG-1b]|nr:DEAD-domain-containing protein [Rhodotorula sp. JG-1b]